MNNLPSNLGSILLAATLGCACLLPGSMRAGGTNTVVEPKVSGVRIQPDLSKYNVNKNGKLDFAEMQAFQQDFMRQRAARLEAQRQALRQARLEQLARQGIPHHVPAFVLQQYDANHNGILDPDEWALYRADQLQKHPVKQNTVRDPASTIPTGPRP